jgi:hypothetical protein
LIGVLIILDHDIAHVACPSRRTVTPINAITFAVVDTKQARRILFLADFRTLVFTLRTGKKVGPIRGGSAIALVDIRSFTSSLVGSSNGLTFSTIVASQISTRYLIGIVGIVVIVQNVIDLLWKFASESSPSRSTNATLTNIIGVAFRIIDTKVGAFQSHSVQWLGTKLGRFVFTRVTSIGSSFSNGSRTIAMLGFGGCSIFGKE